MIGRIDRLATCSSCAAAIASRRVLAIHRQQVLHLPVTAPKTLHRGFRALGQSMTCVAGEDQALETAREISDAAGTTVVIDEELMVAATALCACGVAFFLRAIRAASQGGIEIGFHPEESLAMAAQTALSAAALTHEMGRHPEREIDTVTTPRGCTIVGLNELEHRGSSSALIKGILAA